MKFDCKGKQFNRKLFYFDGFQIVGFIKFEDKSAAFELNIIEEMFNIHFKSPLDLDTVKMGAGIDHKAITLGTPEITVKFLNRRIDLPPF